MLYHKSGLYHDQQKNFENMTRFRLFLKFKRVLCRKIIEKLRIFNIFYKIVKKWKNNIFFSRNDDADFEKGVLLHVGPVLIIKKLIFY